MLKFNTFLKITVMLGILTTLTLIPSAIETETNPSTSSLIMILQTNKPNYIIREPVTITGTLLEDGTPVTNALIAIEILNPRGNPIAFRTLTVGNPTEKWQVTVTDFTLKNQQGQTISKATPNSQVRVDTTIKNNLLNSVNILITITITDETLIPIYTAWTQATVEPNEEVKPTWQFLIPEWTKPGEALVFINVYNDSPKNGGIPYAPEKNYTFYIVRNSQAEPQYAPKINTYTTSPGTFNFYMRMSPDRYARSGTYKVYTTARISPIEKTSTQTTFTYENTDPCPPQAAFTYYPLTIYQNMTVTFDASSSSAEGFNDTITKYEWTINDPYNPQHIIKEGNYTNPPDPTTKHTFEYPGTFAVELNVTDNEGLWSTTTKPVTVYPEYGPTANFTYTPSTPIVNRTVIFNATSSTPGWSAKLADYSSIINYNWNFSDGTNITITDPVITHNFTQPGNYTVTLKITDSVGRTDSVFTIIQVFNVTAKPWDINGDGKVDVKDVFAVAQAYGSFPGDPNWNPKCDLNNDGKVDVKDVFIVATHYGEDP